MSTTGGHAGGGGARAVVLARYRPTIDTTEGEAHLLPLPLCSAAGQRQMISTLCERQLHVEHLETVRPGQGLWCSFCFIVHVLGGPSASVPFPSPFPFPGTDGRTDTGTGTDGLDTVAGRLAVGVAYQRLGWPVTLRCGEVSLNIDRDADAVALAIPTRLAAEVAEILISRRCPPAVLAHPAMPTHRVIVAGERFPVPLDWPTGVHRFTGTLLLPPTVTDRGPVCWARPPVPHALRLCRELDVAAALRSAAPGNP